MNRHDRGAIEGPDAVMFRQSLARPGLTDLGHFSECRHFDFEVDANDAIQRVILMALDMQPTYSGFFGDSSRPG